MATCCNNTVTPRMIIAGNVSVGDRIQLDEPESGEVMVSQEALSSETAAEESSVKTAKVVSEKGPEAVLAASTGIEGIPEGVRFTSPGRQTQANASQNNWSNASIYGLNASKSEPGFEPLPYSQMTSYMSNVSTKGNADSPSIITPSVPMTPNGYDEEIDYESVQAFNGFLRTQIGRYMRIEQLIGSNTIEDRFGFLVGVGSNFIILQEITTGNIMVLDIFSIRLTYIYYSPPVFPNV